MMIGPGSGSETCIGGGGGGRVKGWERGWGFIRIHVVVIVT